MKTTILTIDYGMSLLQMMADGNYIYLDHRIAYMPLSFGANRVTFEMKPFHDKGGKYPYMMDASWIRVIRQMEKEGYVPAKIEHLLAFGAICGKRRNQEIIALGSVARIDGLRYAVTLESGSKRHLHLAGGERYDWFLGVREVQPKS